MWVSLPLDLWILVPRPGIEPESPVLEGKLLTKGPPRKSQYCSLHIVLLYFNTHSGIFYSCNQIVYKFLIICVLNIFVVLLTH